MYLVITYIYMWTLHITEWVTKVKPNINLVGVNLLPSYNGHIVGGGGAGSFWTTL